MAAAKKAAAKKPAREEGDDRTQAERRVHEADDPQRRSRQGCRRQAPAAHRDRQEDLGVREEEQPSGQEGEAGNINADDALKEVFGGKETVTMFEMTALVNKNLS